MNSVTTRIPSPQPAAKRRKPRFNHEVLLELSTLEMELQRLRMEESKLVSRSQQIRARSELLVQRQTALYAQLNLPAAQATASGPLRENRSGHKSSPAAVHQTWSY